MVAWSRDQDDGGVVEIRVATSRDTACAGYGREEVDDSGGALL
jgi:hypothetical protein